MSSLGAASPQSLAGLPSSHGNTPAAAELVAATEAIQSNACRHPQLASSHTQTVLAETPECFRSPRLAPRRGHSRRRPSPPQRACASKKSESSQEPSVLEALKEPHALERAEANGNIPGFRRGLSERAR